MKTNKSLSRREREIMDIIYEMREASAQQVMERLPSPPSYSAVRALLRVLEQKGHLTHRQDGPRYVFRPVLPREKARRGALQDVLRTTFSGREFPVIERLPTLAADIAETPEDFQVVQTGGKNLATADVVILGDQVIHAVTNPSTQFTGALHVYGGDFFATPRSEFDPDTFAERPFDAERVKRLFREANARVAAIATRCTPPSSITNTARLPT